MAGFTTASRKALTNFFFPTSICLIGASSKEKSIGFELLRSIKNYGFKGDIYPVNPKGGEILGLKVCASIDALPPNLDLAIVALPKDLVETAILQLQVIGIKSIILITSGFKETGQAGTELEKRIQHKIKDGGIRLVGPNCMGAINTSNSVKLNATFAAELPEPGNIAFLSQSGAIGAAVLNSLKETGIKFGQFISIGNKADVNENDLLEFWLEEDSIKTITFYLESFSAGEDFIKFIKQNDIKKPLIILKAGRSEGGIKAAASHTGALGSNDKVADSVFNQLGIIRAKNLNELFNTAKGFENLPHPKGNRIAVITNAGGPAILAVDAIEEKGLILSSFSELTTSRLKQIVPADGSVNNPVDLLPGGNGDHYYKAIKTILDDKNVDAVISIFVEPVMVDAFDVVEKINTLESDKPVYQVIMPLPEFWEKYRKESVSKKDLFRLPEDPAEIISNILFYKKSNTRNKSSLTTNPKKLKSDSGNGFIPYYMIKNLSEEYNIPLVDSFYIKANLLIKQLDNMKYPLVLKGISKQLLHKSDLNGVKINIKNRDQLLSAEMKIYNSLKEKGFQLDEFLIQPYIKAKHEILIGGFRDPSFGPMIMFGSGGKYVEINNDISIRSAYLSDDDINELINTTKIGKILNGVRGENPCNLAKLKEIITSCAQMMLDYKEIFEFDINPLILAEDNSFNAVDVRIRIN